MIKGKSYYCSDWHNNLSKAIKTKSSVINKYSNKKELIAKKYLTYNLNLSSKSFNQKIISITNNKRLIISSSISGVLSKTVTDKNSWVKLKNRQKNLIRSFLKRNNPTIWTTFKNQDQVKMYHKIIILKLYLQLSLLVISIIHQCQDHFHRLIWWMFLIFHKVWVKF